MHLTRLWAKDWSDVRVDLQNTNLEHTVYENLHAIATTLQQPQGTGMDLLTFIPLLLFTQLHISHICLDLDT